MTDDEDFLANLPADPSNRAMLSAEHGLLYWLLAHHGLNAKGMRLALWRIRTARDVGEATGAMYDQRERLDIALVAARAAETGMPASYWDKPIVDLPDDVSELEPDDPDAA